MTTIEATAKDMVRRVKASKTTMAIVMLIVVVPAVVYSVWSTVALCALLVIAVSRELKIAMQRIRTVKADVLSCLLLIQMIGGIGCLIWVRSIPDGIAVLIVVAACVFSNDAAAQVTGRTLKKHGYKLHPMAPKISPNKSWEGFGGGLVGGWFAGSLTVTIMSSTSTSLPSSIWWIVIVCPLLAVTGDLIESWTKRSLDNLKDFGDTLGAHGGVMDRIDAITMALIGTSLILVFGLGV